MTQTIRAKDLLKIIENMAYAIEKNVDYLTRLDSEIGDGDHGINLNRSFKEIRQKLGGLKDGDFGMILKMVGSTLISSTGGAVGPLYGTAFMRGGEVVEGKREIDLNDLVEIFDAAERGIQSIGGAKVGEKTMLDTFHPAVETLKEAKSKNFDLIEAFKQCVGAAEKGMQSTKQMVAKKGRSMFLGERARGHQDVGATSCYLMLKSALDSLETLRQK